MGGFLTYFPALGVFFAQDDFILISEFSGNGILQNFFNVLGLPTVSHWRPFFNLFFTISGTIFGKNYQLYHLLLLIILVLQSLLVFKIGKKLLKNDSAAFISALIFLLHPAFFTAVYWISGGAVSIGFLFFLLGFWFLIDSPGLKAGVLSSSLQNSLHPRPEGRGFSLGINKKYFRALLLLFLSFMGSESMVVGSLVYAVYLGLFLKSAKRYPLVILSLMIGFLFFLIRFLFLTSPATFEAYRINLSLEQTLPTLKFYALRILGIKEGAVFSLATLFILAAVATAFFRVSRKFVEEKPLIYLAVATLILGLFPFVLIPFHASAHYMAMSVWGFCLIIAWGLTALKKLGLILLLFLLAAYLFNNLTIYENPWIISRSKLAKTYISNLQNNNLENGTNIVFTDNFLSSSKDAYIALGTGKAIDWFFRGKNYKVCFSGFETCEVNNSYVPFR